MKIFFCMLSALLGTQALAMTPTTESFVASSVIVQQIKNQNLLGTHQYDALLEKALERVAGTAILLANCEPALGTFSCDLTIVSNQTQLALEVDIHDGDVVSAKANP